MGPPWASGERAYAAMEPTADRLEEVAAQLITEYTSTKVVTHALAEVFILATARRVNAASTIESSVGIGEACHHVAYCRIMIAIIGKAEVAAEPIRI